MPIEKQQDKRKLKFDAEVEPYEEDEEVPTPIQEEDDEEVPTPTMKTKAYTMKLICANCMHVQDYRLKFGTLVKTYRENNECPKCGCLNTLYPATTTQQ